MTSPRHSETKTGTTRATSSSRLPFPGAGRTVVAGAGLFVFVALAAAALMGNYERTRTLEREATAREASTVIGAVEAGINVHVRPGAQYIEERLQTYLDTLVVTSPALAIALVDEQGEPFMSAGEKSLIDEGSQWAEARVEENWQLREGRARFHRRIHPRGASQGPGAGRSPRGRDRWSDFPSGSYRVAIVMDTGDLTSRLASARLRLWSSLGSLVVMTGLVLLAAGSFHRRRRLEEDLRHTRELALQHERLTRLGAGLAHETRNPLGVVRGLMQSIVTDMKVDEKTRRTAKDAIDEVDRTVGRINSFLHLSRPVDPNPIPVELGSLFDGVTRLLATEAPEGVDIGFKIDGEDLLVLADPDMLRRSLFNLGLNSLRVFEGKGRLRFEADGRRGDFVEIRVIDNGGGIEPEDLARVTEPYFTKSPDGSGLGLSIVDRIATAHGWRLKIESEPGSGTTVTLAGLRRVT